MINFLEYEFLQKSKLIFILKIFLDRPVEKLVEKLEENFVIKLIIAIKIEFQSISSSS